MNRLVRVALVVLAVCAGVVRANGVAPSVLVQAYFDSLARTFDHLVADRAMTRLELTPANRLFVQSIQMSPAFYTLMRTNSKGVIINEVVRGKGRVKGYRSLAGQRWYGRIRDELEPYRATVSDKQKRSYLLWAYPIVILGSSGTRRFGGVAVVKVDLREGFQAVAQLSEYPFRVLSAGTEVFAHRWEGGLDYDEATVEIAGLASVVVQEIRRSPEPAPVEADEYGETVFAGSLDPEGEASIPAARRHWWAVTGRLAALVAVGVLLTLLVQARLRWRHILSQIYRDTPG